MKEFLTSNAYLWLGLAVIAILVLAAAFSDGGPSGAPTGQDYDYTGRDR